MNWLPIYKKELRTFFNSPMAYVILFGFVGIIGFWWYILDFRRYLMFSMQAGQNPQFAQMLNVNEMVIASNFGNISLVILFLLPLLTMRMFAEEKKSGTYELLFTLPLRDWHTLLGKFLANWTVLLLMLALTTIYPLTMAVLTNPEPWPIVIGYLGMFLMGGAFISIGIFVSSLTENQIIAAFGTYAILLIILSFSFTEGAVGPVISAFLTEINIFSHLREFLRGVIDTNDLVFYVLVTFFFLFLTLRSLESKRWRG